MLDREPESPSEAQLADQLEGVARCPVLDDPPVFEAADHDAAQLDLPSLVGAAEGPARGDLVALGDLVLDVKAQVGEERQVERHRLAGSVVAAVYEAVDVIDKVGVIVARDPVQVLAGANLLEGPASSLGVVGGGGGRHGCLLPQMVFAIWIAYTI